MATLTVRSPKLSDLWRIRRVRQRREDPNFPFSEETTLDLLNEWFLISLPGKVGETEGVVALVDDELCGYAILERDDERFQWKVIALAAGSPRLDANDAVSTELWTAVLEYAVKEAGRAGARRIFGNAAWNSAGGVAMEQAGFAPYMRFQVLRGQIAADRSWDAPLCRLQHESDAWSIHQLYHRVTPRPVQYAEARTSDWWLDGLASSIPGRSGKIVSVVVDELDGLAACCRIHARRRCPLVTVLCSPELSGQVVGLVARALESVDLLSSEVEVVIPDYAQELVAGFLDAGLTIEDRRVALVRHTTTPRVVHPVFEASNIEALAARRGVRGAPNLTSRSPDPVPNP